MTTSSAAVGLPQLQMAADQSPSAVVVHASGKACTLWMDGTEKMAPSTRKATIQTHNARKRVLWKKVGCFMNVFMFISFKKVEQRQKN
jgi:hypothetical protein